MPTPKPKTVAPQTGELFSVWSQPVQGVDRFVALVRCQQHAENFVREIRLAWGEGGYYSEDCRRIGRDRYNRIKPEARMRVVNAILPLSLN